MQRIEPSSWSHCHTSPKDRANQFRVTVWSLLWVVSWLGTTLAIVNDWLPSGPPVVLLTAVSALIGVGMISAYRRFLRQADELRRKIELDALALAVGVGLVGGVAYELLSRAEMVAGGRRFMVAMMLICLTYVMGVVFGIRRYT